MLKIIFFPKIDLTAWDEESLQPTKKEKDASGSLFHMQQSFGPP